MAEPTMGRTTDTRLSASAARVGRRGYHLCGCLGIGLLAPLPELPPSGGLLAHGRPAYTPRLPGCLGILGSPAPGSRGATLHRNLAAARDARSVDLARPDPGHDLGERSRKLRTRPPPHLVRSR